MRRRGANPVAVGIAMVGVAALIVFFAVARNVPLTNPSFRFQAVFRSANELRKSSVVRIAGVNVGKVTAIEHEGTGARVTMEMTSRGLPLHRDATLKIRPRLFLEGNFFVDLRPGTPGGGELPDGGTIPAAQTAVPVQLDQVLTALQSDSRRDLQDLLAGYGTALTHRPTAAEDAIQDPEVRGLTGAEAINRSYRYGARALRNTALANDATLGTRPHDLSNLVAGFGRIAAGLDRDERGLGDLVGNADTTFAAFADRRDPLRRTIRLLAPTLRGANRTFASLNRSFVPTRAFARDLLPAVRETAPTIDAAFPWLRQARLLFGRNELRGLVNDARPATADLARLTDRTLPLLDQADLVARCATGLILPAGDVKLDDGPLSSGTENFKEFWHAMEALAGEGQNFDGNGDYVRFNVGAGSQSVSTGASSQSGQTLFGTTQNRPLGNRPIFPGKRPAYRPDVECASQTLPDFNGPAANGGKP